MKHTQQKRLQRGRTIPLLAAIVLVLGLVLATGPMSVVQAASINVNGSCTDTDSNGLCDDGVTYKTIQAAINAASAGDTVNVAAGTYTDVITVNKENLILAGAPGATITVAETVIGISIAANGVQVSGFTIEGPHTGSYISNDWDAPNFTGTEGIRVLSNVTGVVITGNQISDVRSGIQTLSGSSATINGNAVNNTKGSILVRGETTTATGNTPGPDGNEWDIVIMTSLYGNPVVVTALLPLQGDLAAYGQAIMTLSEDNGGMTILDRRFGDSNRSHASVAVGFSPTPAEDFGLGNGLGNPRQPYGSIQHGITAVAPGGIVNVAAGTYTENVNVNKSVTLNGANAGIDPNIGPRGSESTIQGQLTIDASNVMVDGFTLTNPAQPYGVLIQPNSDQVTISNDMVTNVGGNTYVGGQVKGIYLRNGPDNVTISDNQFSNIKSGSTKSADAIFVGDSTSTNPSTGLLIENNMFSDIAAGKGGYAILINNSNNTGVPTGGGTPNARIRNNTITGVSGTWAHAIGLEGDTPNAVVTGNTISNVTDGSGTDAVGIMFEDNSSGGTVKLNFNSFSSVAVGVAIHPKHGPAYPYVVNAINNWWGHASGPSDGGLGTTDPSTGTAANGNGVIVGPSVRFDPWLGADVEDVASQTVGNGGNVSTSDGSVSVTYTGLGNPTLTVAKYTGNPGDTSTAIGTGGSYVDINLSGNTDPGDTLTVDFVFNDPSIAGDPLYWFDGSDWLGVVDNSGNVPHANGSGNYVGVVFGPASSPTLAQLNGTAFTPGVTTEIRLVPSVTTLAAGETLAVEVQATSLGLYGVDVLLNFDETKLKVTNVVLGGGLFADVVAVNTYNNNTGTGTGTLNFAYSQKAGTPGHPNNVIGDFNAPILLATITFHAEAAGASPSYLVSDALLISSALFSNKDGADTAPGILDGASNPVALTINPSPSVYVDIALQGRTSVAATSGASLEMKPTGVGSVLYSTVVDSHLDIDPAPAKEYIARVDAPKYLAVIQTVTILPNAVTWDLNGSVIDTPSTLFLTLRGGDINGDDRINIQDLVMIGVRFGETNGAVNWLSFGNLANINDDSSVNIQDLSIAAGNFGLETTAASAAKGYPTPWQ